MTDPLDSLFTSSTPSEPDPEFRARLMAGVRTALMHGAPESLSAFHATTLDIPTLEVVPTNVRPARLHRGQLTGIVTAAALVIIAVVVVAFGRAPDTDPGELPVATQPQAVASTSTTVALTDDDVAVAALLTSGDVGGGIVAQVGETYLSHYNLGADLPECASFVRTVFTPLASATTRTRDFGKVNVRFQQMAIVFPTVDAATTMMDTVTGPSYRACDTAVLNAAVNATACCQQAAFQTAPPLALRPAGDQQWANAQIGTYVAGATQRTTRNLISFTRVGRVVIVFGVGVDLDGHPTADPDQLIAASIARLASMPTGEVRTP